MVLALIYSTSIAALSSLDEDIKNMMASGVAYCASTPRFPVVGFSMRVRRVEKGSSRSSRMLASVEKRV